MSLDIDWSLLTPSSLSTNLVDLLNAHLSSASRPSFIGPITVTSFDFGTVPPDVEIKDIRDVWRAFDEGDEEGDDQLALHSSTPPHPARRNTAVSSGIESDYEVIEREEVGHATHDNDDDLASIYSGLASPRQSVLGVGVGLHANTGFLRDQGLSPFPLRSRPPSVFSQAIQATKIAPPSSQQAMLPPHTSPPASPPARPAGVSESKSSIPSLQLHLKISYISNLHITLLTSLSVNYPSPGFMSLPLKLSITGLTLGGNVILAYSGEKHRVHLCLVDDDETANNVPIGQKILPTLSMESEIGHADAHVLRNVGKVERFIADVVRQTLVEELVFPNFLTLAL